MKPTPPDAGADAALAAPWSPADDLRLRAAIEDAFTELALYPGRSAGPGAGLGSRASPAERPLTGAALARALGYTPELLASLPEEAVASFSGVGNPFPAGVGRSDLPPGVVVLDVGCGSGTDLLVAARLVGPRGLVIGVDMTPAMVERALECAVAARLANVHVEWGHAESLPLPDASVDVVMTNGAVTLSPDKRGALRELARVLRPGGRLIAHEVLVERARPRPAADLPGGAFAGWIWGMDGGLVERGLDADLERFQLRNVRLGARRPARHRLPGASTDAGACIAEIRAVRR